MPAREQPRGGEQVVTVDHHPGCPGQLPATVGVTRAGGQHPVRHAGATEPQDPARTDEEVDLAPQDTALVPDSGPTVASRTAMVVGGLLIKAAGRLRAEVEAATGGSFAATNSLTATTIFSLRSTACWKR